MRSRTTQRLAAPAGGVLIALLLLAALIPLRLGTANAQEAVQLEGDDEVSAAIAISEYTFPDGADAAYLGRADLFADSLSSGGGQGVDDAPLLLTETDALNEDTAAELERLGAEDVFIMGGEVAVSTEVEDELEAEGYTVTRYEGETRTETAIALAEAKFGTATEAILARSHAATADETQAFADSLAAGGWAADDEFPVLLTLTDELTATTREYLESSSILTINVIGGEDAISEEVVDELEAMTPPRQVNRVGGNTRFETAIEIAEARGFAAGDTEQVVLVAEGQASDAWAAGFAGASLADQADAPIVLVNGDTVPAPTEEFLTPAGDNDAEAFPFAGPFCEDIPLPPICETETEVPSESPTGGSPSPTGSPGGPGQDFTVGLPGVSDEAFEQVLEIRSSDPDASESPS